MSTAEWVVSIVILVIAVLSIVFRNQIVRFVSDLFLSKAHKESINELEEIAKEHKIRPSERFKMWQDEHYRKRLRDINSDRIVSEWKRSEAEEVKGKSESIAKDIKNAKEKQSSNP